MSRLTRRFALALAALALAAPLAVRAQQKRPMTIDDLLTAVRIADPQLSPDGTRVIFTRTTTALATGQRNADVWVVPADGSAPAAMLIGGPKSENTARFLPDGHIAFLSSRDGEMQVYVADADGQNARAVTALSGGVQPPLVVSPDGKMVAFVSDAYPDCANEACNKNAREAEAKDPVKMRTLTRLPFRHWDEWREELRHHVFVTDIASGSTRDLTPGDFDAPPHNYEDGAIAFSLDSREVAFVSKRDAKDSEMWTTNHDVWTVPAAGGALKKVTSNPAADMQPVYSPDGKSILVRAQRRAGFEADRWYLDAYDRASGLKRTVFETPDSSVEDYHFSPDGRAIWFTAVEKGTTNLYVVPAANGTPKMMARGGSISSVQSAQNFAIFSKSMLAAPAEIFRVGLDGATKALTHENASWLAGVEMPLPESLTIPGAGGAPIQYWVLKPPQFDPSKTYPVVFLIHGGPQSDWGDGWSSRWNPALWAAQGWVVVAPNPRGSTGFGQKFVDDISQDWCGKVMTDLDAVFDNVSKQAYVDPARMGIAGASYGGYAVDWIIGHSNRFKAAVTHDGVFNLESMALATEELWFSEWDFGGPPWSATARLNYAKCSPHLWADKIKTPTLVITNEQDFRVPVDQGLQLFTALRRNGVPSQALVFPDEGHWVLKALNSKRWHEAVFAWLKKYLG
jgi:dipeptidyl aminopeptidase/acylaminoacyl peptidase